MARIRSGRLIVGLASAALLATSLWTSPSAMASESDQLPATEESASELVPAALSSPEPSVSPKPSSTPSPTPAAGSDVSGEEPESADEPPISPSPSPTPTSSELPSAAPSPGTDPAVDGVWLECEVDTTNCPAAPALALEEVQATAAIITWTLEPADSEGPTPAEVLVRIGPLDRELTFEAAAGRAEITDLEPSTDYSITLYAIDGKQLSAASNTISIRTKVEKRLASPGEVSRLIIDTVSDNDPKGATRAASADLPVDGVAVTEVQDIGNDNVVVQLTSGISDADAAEVIADLEQDPRIASVEIDEKVRFAAFPADPPDDTYWTSNALWGLYGQYGIGIASGQSSMNNVWTAGQGDDVVVAVLDTGSTVHPDLNDNYVAGYDFVNDGPGWSYLCDGRSGATNEDGDYVDTSTYGALGWDNNPLDPGDWDNCYASSWHGTHVAGTVAAAANNGQGVVGVAPRAKIQPIRVLTYGGGRTSDIAAAVTWASGGSIDGVPANATPADIINLSLGRQRATCPTAIQDAITAAVARGSVVVVSAGNSDLDASGFSPANCEGVITVASSTSSGIRSSFSNFGTTVDIAAPGSGILSTMNTGTTTPGSPSYTSYSGTSMAAPHVAGVAALLKAQDNTRTPSQILSLLQSSAQAFPSTGSAYDCSTSTCGAGLLSAGAAGSTAPFITGISPASGDLGGGDTVTISGYNLTGTTDVTFGSSSGTSVSVSSATSLTVLTPAGAAGVVDVTVTTPEGSATSAGGFTYVAPAPSPGGGGGGSSGGSSGGASSSGSSGASSGGGGGGLNAVTTIVPSAAGEPGSRIALAGWGLETARDVRFNDVSAQFTLVSDRQVDVVVPDVPPGVYVVHVVLAPTVGRASYWEGFSVLPRSGSSADPSTGVAPVDERPTLEAGTSPAAEFVSFSGNKTAMTRATRSKLAQIARDFTNVNDQAVIVTYTNEKETKASVRRAEKRANNMRRYLTRSGFQGDVTVRTEPGDTRIQQRGAMIYVEPATTAEAESSRGLTSVIIRLKKGRSPTVDGQVRGVDQLPSSLRSTVSLGSNLGLRMYRLDLAEPVSQAQAERIAELLARDPGIAFAEPDSFVTKQVSARQ